MLDVADIDDKLFDWNGFSELKTVLLSLFSGNVDQEIGISRKSAYDTIKMLIDTVDLVAYVVLFKQK